MLGGFVLSLVVIFTSRKTIRPALIFAYAAFEGLFVGGISAYFEMLYEGIVLQATLATLSVVGVTLALFASGKIRASKRATKIFMIAMIGYLVFSLLNLVLMWFGAPIAGGAFGLAQRRGSSSASRGASSSASSSSSWRPTRWCSTSTWIQQGVRNGAPRKYGWLGGFGIMVTVVWLYVEILRILAIARN